MLNVVTIYFKFLSNKMLYVKRLFLLMRDSCPLQKKIFYRFQNFEPSQTISKIPSAIIKSNQKCFHMFLTRTQF